MPLAATEVPFLTHPASGISFVKTEISAAPGEMVEICVERDLQSIITGSDHESIIVREDIPFADQLKLTFSLTGNQACYDFFVDDDTPERSYEVKLFGSQEVAVLTIKGKAGKCGAVPRFKFLKILVLENGA